MVWPLATDPEHLLCWAALPGQQLVRSACSCRMCEQRCAGCRCCCSGSQLMLLPLVLAAPVHDPWPLPVSLPCRRDLPRLIDIVQGGSSSSSFGAASEAAGAASASSVSSSSSSAAGGGSYGLPRPGGRTAAINVQLSADETYADIVPVRQPDALSAFVSIMRGCNNSERLFCCHAATLLWPGMGQPVIHDTRRGATACACQHLI